MMIQVYNWKQVSLPISAVLPRGIKSWMNKSEAIKMVSEIVSEIVEADISLSENSRLFGEGGLLDSMKLVQLCLNLEDRALEEGFEFDWTSSSMMSRSKSMFRSLDSIAEEFSKQSQVLS